MKELVNDPRVAVSEALRGVASDTEMEIGVGVQDQSGRERLPPAWEAPVRMPALRWGI